MNSKSCRLKFELEEGLRRYGEDNNISPISIIEELVEEFLTDKEYLSINPVIEKGDDSIEKIKYASYTGRRYQIGKRINGKEYKYGSITQGASLTKELVAFLESVNWDTKYSTGETGLKGADQINFLLNEMEKEKKLREIE